MAEIVKIVIGGDTSKYDKALSEIKAKNKNLEQELVSVGKKAAVAFAGFAGTIGLAVSQAAKFETINTQFEVLTGSVDKANRLVKDLADFASSTPFEFEGITKAASQLLGFGFTAEQMPGLLQEIGDVAAAAGRPINEMALIFGQVSAAGKLTGERLLQMQERAIPIGPALAKTMGVAETSIRDLVSQGKVDFETFQQAFASLSKEGGFAFEGLIKQSKTTSGVLANLSDNFSLLLAEIGQMFLPVVKKVSLALGEFFDVVRNNSGLVKMAGLVLGVGTALTGVTAALAFGAVGFIKLKQAIDITIVSIRAMNLSIKSLLSATGIGLLLVGLSALVVYWDEVWSGMTATFKAFAKNITDISGGLKNILGGIFTLDMDQVQSGLDQLKSAFAQTFDEIKENYKKNLEERKEAQAETGSAMLEKEAELQEASLSQNQAYLDAMVEAQKKADEAIATSKLTNQESADVLRLEHAAELQELVNENRNLDLQVAQEIEMEKTRLMFEEQKKRLKDEAKYGKDYAKLHAAIRNEHVQGAADAADQLAVLQNSSNKKMKGIGKAAALVQIAMKTAEGAISAYASLAGIPLIGPALGGAAAAALIAYGGEQASKVMGLARGGMAVGGTPGVDSVPAMLTPGELVGPKENFDEIVDSVARTRALEATGFTGVESDGEGPSELQITFTDNIVEFIETKLIERGRLKIGLGFA